MLFRSDGNALLYPHEDGMMKINVKELSRGSYKLLLNVVSDKSEDVEVGVHVKDNINWINLENVKNTARPYLIGDVTIQNPSEPIRVLFKANNNKVLLNRVMMIKK